MPVFGTPSDQSTPHADAASEAPKAHSTAAPTGAAPSRAAPVETRVELGFLDLR